MTQDAATGRHGAQPGIDPALVRAAQRGDPLALAELMELLTPYVGRICGPIARQDGPDAAQEALIVILRGLRQLREPAALLGWARTIAVREAVRVVRRAGRTVAEPLAELRAAGDPELAADIEDALARLTPEHRAVLLLRDVAGVDETSASSMLSVPLGTVRSRLARARQSFRKVWES